MTPEATKQEASLMLVEAAGSKQQTASLVLRTKDDYDAAGTALKRLKERWNSVEERRKAWTAPLNAVVKDINNTFRPVLDAWDDTMANVKKAMLDFDRRNEEAKRLALEQAAQLARENQTGEQYMALVAAGSADAVKTQGISKRVTYKWRVVDAGAIPPEFWVKVIDAAKLDALVAAQKSEAKVPGIEVYAEETLAVRL